MSYKTWRSIDITLDKASLTNAIKEIRDCQRQLTEAMNALIRELADQGAQVAKMQVASFDAVDSGELEHSIYGYFDSGSRIGYVIAGAAHAFYVEYGTGIVGAENPHPEPGTASWQYDINNHGTSGWWYPSENGWYIPKDENGDPVGDTRYAWTKGMPSRPFMYNTFIWLEEAAEALGRKILS